MLEDLNVTSTSFTNLTKQFKHGKDTRPQNHQNATQEQHKDLCTIPQGAFNTLHTIHFGVGGAICNTHTI